MNSIQAPVVPTICAIAAQLPEPRWSTEELLAASKDRFSDKLKNMLLHLGVENRHSVLTNYPAVLFEGAEPELAISGSTLAVQAAQTCIEKAAVGPIVHLTNCIRGLLPSFQSFSC